MNESTGESGDLMDETIAQARELAGVDASTAAALASIVGDEFGIEMITPWGDRWIWVKVDGEVAQEIYKLLGMPIEHLTPASTGTDLADDLGGPPGNE